MGLKFKTFIITVIFAICVPFSQANLNNIKREVEDNGILRSNRPSTDETRYYDYLKSQIKFWYYPGELWDECDTELLHYNSTLSLSTSRLQKGQPYKILIHGYLENGKTTFANTLAQAYRNKMLENYKREGRHYERINIVAVGWGTISGNQKDKNFREYDRVVEMLPFVADRVADFILFLRKKGYLKSMDHVHCIGHSLGAHICGLTGQHIQNKTGGESLARITALDPAGPLITPELHLKKEYGKFVDVIHTDYNTTHDSALTDGDEENYESGFSLGSDKVCGHVDFYPNGGSEYYLGVLSIRHPCYGIQVLTGLDHLCLHTYSYIAYALSISKPQGSMKGYKCSSYGFYESPLGYGCKWWGTSAVFGEYIDTNNTESGQYYLGIDKYGNTH